MINKNPLDEYKILQHKAAAFAQARRNNVTAIKMDGTFVPINTLKMSDVAFVGGLWRVQNDFPYEITRVRDQNMVLFQKLDRVENTLFEFWTAKTVGYNAYGPFISGSMAPEYIVAKYETDNAVYWGYGRTLEEARAYLGLKLYDEFKDLINSVACKNKIKNK